MLFLVPTPLGNLDDLSPRALKALREAKAVYCEDTRRTRQLMARFGLSTPLLRYREDDEAGVERILARVAAGEDVALASDAGTPVLSDPGLRLVSRARRAGLPVTVLPGPFAAACAVAGSGLPGDSFVFLGFLPRSPGKRRKALSGAAVLEKTLVVYESPYRIVDLLEIAQETLGRGAQAAVCRELSKIHEEWLTGTVEQVLGVLKGRDKLLGEFVAVFHPESRGG